MVVFLYYCCWVSYDFAAFVNFATFVYILVFIQLISMKRILSMATVRSTFNNVLISPFASPAIIGVPCSDPVVAIFRLFYMSLSVLCICLMFNVTLPMCRIVPIPSHPPWHTPYPILSSGRKRKLGFRKKSKSTITVHRSEEILPTGSRHLMRQSSSQSSEEAEGEDRCGEGALWSLMGGSRSPHIVQHSGWPT